MQVTNGKSIEELKERAKKIKIIFFDIDETLRRKNTSFMPLSIYEAVKRLRIAGIKVGIATGRAKYMIVPDILDLEMDYFATINGQLMMNTGGDILAGHPMEKELVHEVFEFVSSQDLGEGRFEFGSVGAYGAGISQWTDTNRELLGFLQATDSIEECRDYYLKHDSYQLWALGGGKIEDIPLPQSLDGKVKFVRWSPYALDILPVDASKARGIQEIVENSGLTAENVMVFGDERNDIEMFTYAGLAVCMIDGRKEAIAQADMLAPVLEEDGILKALKTLELI